MKLKCVHDWNDVWVGVCSKIRWLSNRNLCVDMNRWHVLLIIIHAKIFLDKIFWRPFLLNTQLYFFRYFFHDHNKNNKHVSNPINNKEHTLKYVLMIRIFSSSILLLLKSWCWRWGWWCYCTYLTLHGILTFICVYNTQQQQISHTFIMMYVCCGIYLLWCRAKLSWMR